MSLLVFNSSSRISQGLIRSLYQANSFERIVCADLFPSYCSFKRFFNFKDELSTLTSNTQVQDIKIVDKPDLHAAIKNSTHVLYVTHDYYSLVPSKLNLVKQTSSLVKDLGHVKKLVVVSPVEYNHQGEPNAYDTHATAQNEAKNIYPDSVHIEADLTFGSYSGAVWQILNRLVNGQSIKFSPSSAQVSPIHSLDLSEVVRALLTNDVKGAQYTAKGNKSFSWNDILNRLSKAAEVEPTLNKSALENVVSPLSNNILSEAIHCDSYRNLTQFIANYKAPRAGKDLSEFKLQLRDFEGRYQDGSVNKSLYKCNQDMGSKVGSLLFN